MRNEQPRLCVVGPMLGRNIGYVTSQGLILSELLQLGGFQVLAVSSVVNRYLRLVDIVRSLVWRGGKLDMLIIEVYGGPSFVSEDIASSIARQLGCRIVMWLHGGGMPHFMVRFPKWTKRVLGRADVLVTPSEFLARAVDRYGFKAQVIPNVVNLSDYTFHHRQPLRPRLLWMRSFHPIYNPLMAVRVLARLRRTVPEATLVMGGQDKGMEAEVKRAACEMGLDRAIYFPGFIDRAARKDISRECDIFINTSHVDNAPVAVLEACTMGMPVVATAVGGIPDLLCDGETGLLVPDNDDAAMADAISSLLAEPALVGQLSDNARQLAERSSWDVVRPQWEQVFAEAMATPHCKRRISQ